MNSLSKTLIAALCVFTLSGCVSREDADATLKLGCVAGIKALLPDGTEMGDIQEIAFEHSPIGNDFRHIGIKAIQDDGWLQEEKQYVCIFQENFGMFNSHHTASIHQIRIGEDKIVGKVGNDIIGTPDEFLKLTEAIRVSMQR